MIHETHRDLRKGKTGAMTRRGIPIVLSGPSGVGKGSVAARLLERDPATVHSVSMTTRAPRPGEQEGVNYFFVSRQRFEEAVRNGELAEWARVYGSCYGTPRSFLEERFESGVDVILDIDIQGASSVRAFYREALLIYLAPPSLDALRERLLNRPKSETDDLEMRLRAASAEMRYIGMFEYVVINDDLERAVNEVESVIRADRQRLQRMRPFLLENGLMNRMDTE